MNEMHEIDRGRFVDGEMTAEEERTFLAECEQEPDRWRLLALEMVEQRMIEHAMRSRPAPQPALPNRRNPLWQVGALAMAVGIVMGLVIHNFFPGKRALEQPQPIAGAPDVETKVEPVADRLLPREPFFGKEERGLLREAGLDVREDAVLYVIESDEGQQFLLPFRYATIHPFDAETPPSQPHLENR